MLVPRYSFPPCSSTRIHSPSPHFVSSRVYGSQFGGEDFKKEEKKRGKSVEENGRWIRAVRFDRDEREGIGGGRERVWDTCFFLPSFFSLLLFLARIIPWSKHGQLVDEQLVKETRDDENDVVGGRRIFFFSNQGEKLVL